MSSMDSLMLHLLHPLCSAFVFKHIHMTQATFTTWVRCHAPPASPPWYDTCLPAFSAHYALARRQPTAATGQLPSTSLHAVYTDVVNRSSREPGFGYSTFCMLAFCRRIVEAGSAVRGRPSSNSRRRKTTSTRDFQSFKFRTHLLSGVATCTRHGSSAGRACKHRGSSALQPAAQQQWGVESAAVLLFSIPVYTGRERARKKYIYCI